MQFFKKISLPSIVASYWKITGSTKLNPFPSYYFSTVSTKFEEAEICETELNIKYGDQTENNFMMREFYKHKFPHPYVRKLIEIQKEVKKNKTYLTYMMSRLDDRRWLWDGHEEMLDWSYCKRNLQYRAEVIFRMATDSISVTVMSRRLSFFDKMSAFGMYNLLELSKANFSCSGGTLGLFTGISILSMIEVVFWIVRYLVTNARTRIAKRGQMA